MRHGLSRHTNRLTRQTADTGAAVVSQAAEQGREAMATAQELGARVQEAASEGFEYVRDATGRYVKQGQAGAKFLYRGLAGAIETRPILTLALALGCGLLLGSLLRRRTTL
jgi:hypothetical protein